ncbi:hypothetical protein Gferi_05275 [Geosporobacter ferrireducens]|uniref:Uncharacterized protein n=1 Tax=Geosporobacter ferrireducens TaxID=1424294 RepID=A0A1D8GDN2_9FIRM|nr:hypothetical protein Gferi_05275 [Geosporobacter ferrireducens]
MLRMPLLVLFLRAIPEGIILMLSCYALSNTVINKNKIFLSGILLGISVYIIRFMPIRYGIHTILCLIVYMLMAVKLNNISILKSIHACIISIIVLFICDWIMTVFYINILNISFEEVLKVPVKSALYSMPSLCIALSISLTVFYIQKRKLKQKI